MLIYKSKCCLFIDLFLVCSAFAQAQNTRMNDPNVLQEQINQLKQQINNMQKTQDAEINALKKQLGESSSLNAVKKPENELASLRQLAQAEAAKESTITEKPEDVTFIKPTNEHDLVSMATTYFISE